MSERTSAAQAYTVGRGGVKIPDYEWRDLDAQYQMDNFRHFFHAFWEVNGVSLVSTTQTEPGAPREQLPYFHELVLPSAADKPLTVVRASYTPRLQSRVNADARADSQHRAYERNGYVVGTEKHELLVPPLSGGLQFDSLLTLTDDHYRGMPRNLESTVRLAWQGSPVSARSYEISHDKYPDISQWQDASRGYVAQGLRSVLNDTIRHML